MSKWYHLTTYNIVSGNGLLHNNTKPLPEPILTCKIGRFPWHLLKDNFIASENHTFIGKDLEIVGFKNFGLSPYKIGEISRYWSLSFSHVSEINRFKDICIWIMHITSFYWNLVKYIATNEVNHEWKHMHIQTQFVFFLCLQRAYTWNPVFSCQPHRMGHRQYLQYGWMDP